MPNRPLLLVASSSLGEGQGRGHLTHTEEKEF
nr:MAG TPA: hypothetical protein [Caudoviricetes sp.]